MLNGAAGSPRHTAHRIMKNSLRTRIAVAAAWIAWLLFHGIVAPIAHLLAIWPCRAFSWTVRNVVLPPLRRAAAWCREHSD